MKHILIPCDLVKFNISYSSSATTNETANPTILICLFQKEARVSGERELYLTNPPLGSLIIFIPFNII